MIEKIEINGYKSYLNKSIKLKSLTLLTGLNSSGKSTIIQSLQIVGKAFRNDSDALLEDNGSLREVKNPYYKNNILIKVSDSEGHSATVEILDEPKESKNYTFTNHEIDFPEIIYISADRYGPKSNVPIYNNSALSKKIGKNGENLFQFINQYECEILNESLKHENSEGNTVEFNIRGWLTVICPNVKFQYKIDEKSDSSYSLFNDYRATNVGYGLSYSLSVIAALLISTIIPDCLLIIENPEAHLHPRGQSELAKLISKCANLGTQIIIETHSDHIFDGVRICCKTIDGFSEKVQLHYFELDEHQNTIVNSPIIDDEGKLDEWPQGFFDQYEINASKLL